MAAVTSMARHHSWNPNPSIGRGISTPSELSLRCRDDAVLGSSSDDDDDDDIQYRAPSSATTSILKRARQAGIAVLPVEIIDMIVDFVSHCPRHPWATREKPCANWHSSAEQRALLQLRLVNRLFSHRMTPVAFHHLVFERGANRQLRLSKISRSPHLCQHIRVLRLNISPADLGKGVRRINQNPLITPSQKLRKFFEVLQIYLVPILRSFAPSLTTLHLTAHYDGIQQPSAPVKVHLLPKADLFLPCFIALCKSIRAAGMEALETAVLGIPYNGGHTSYFQELQDPHYSAMLRGLSKSIRSASVQVFDHQNNFTTMSFF